MKKILILLFVLTCVHLKAQDTLLVPKAYKCQARYSITQFFNSALYLAAEQNLKNGNGALCGLGLVYSEANGDVKSGFHSEFQYKMYVTSKAGRRSVSRIYLGTYLVYKYLEKKYSYTIWNNNVYTTVEAKNFFHSFCPGIMAGYNIVSFKRLVIDFYIGGGMKRTFDGDFIGHVNYDNDNIFEPGYNGVVPRCGFEMGITF